MSQIYVPHDTIENAFITQNSEIVLFDVMDTFTDEQVLYNDDEHAYLSLAHEDLISASNFAKGYFPEFDQGGISQRTALKAETDKQIVLDLWEGSRKIGSEFGTLGHYALERHFTYRHNKAYKMPNHPVFQHILTTFPRINEENEVLPEVFISQVSRRMCGIIDAIVIIDKEKKICEIWDYKFSYDIRKSLEKYKVQINYYSLMLECAGWTVTRKIYNYDSEWKEYSVERIELSQLKKKL